MAGELDSKRCRIILGSMETGQEQPVDLIFDRPLSAARLRELDNFRNADARLVFLKSPYFLREAALASVPLNWRGRTFEWEEESSFVKPLAHPGQYAYQFFPNHGPAKMSQILWLLYTFFSVFRIGFYSAMMTAVGPRGQKVLYPLRKTYWFLDFQWKKRISSK